jgi:hypothetical protein
MIRLLLLIVVAVTHHQPWIIRPVIISASSTRIISGYERKYQSTGIERPVQSAPTVHLVVDGSEISSQVSHAGHSRSVAKVVIRR